MNANGTRLYAITNAQYEAHYKTNTGGLIFPSHFYNCLSNVDTKDLAENMGLKRKTDIVGVLITTKEHPGFKNKRNNFVQYKSPTCAESTYDCAFQHTIPTANNGKGFTYWATLNPMGDVIIVLKDIHNDDIVKKGRWNQPPELFVKPPECYQCGSKKGSSCEELYPQIINKTERLICEECVGEFFKPKIGNCNECNEELVEGYYWSRPAKNLMFCADCGQSVLDEEKDEQDLIIIKGNTPEPIPMVSIVVHQLHKPDIVVEVPEPPMVEYDGIKMRKCAIPCLTSPKMGKSWWKGFGYDSPCSCAYETRNKHNTPEPIPVVSIRNAVILEPLPVIVGKPEEKRVLVLPPAKEDKALFESTGCMGEDFMKTFLWDKMNANQKRDTTKLFKADPEGFIEYKNYSFTGKTDGDIGLFYSEIWLLDLSTQCGGKMSPVVVNRINTSSAYAMSRCGMDREEDEEEDEVKINYSKLPKLFKTQAINGARFWESVRHHFV